jgi:hypothetical protein
LKSGFSDKRDWTQLMHIATDGETYGHHHKHGDMALAYSLDCIDSDTTIDLTNYGEFLEKFPPTHEVQIIENTSWSCAHGVERWRSDCGCNSGRAGWNQAWRGPLRAALDYLRDRAAELFEQKAVEVLRDPWAARNDYIDVVLDRSPQALWLFFEKHSRHRLTPEETTTALKLLEMQRHAMLMYTSCGWFFDELSGIETVQVIQYAGRVIQLARETGKVELEPEFLERLAQAKSNIRDLGNGADIYDRWVRPCFVDLAQVGVHYAISSMFNGDHVVPQYCYDIETLDNFHTDSGIAKLALGRIHITSRITRESIDLIFAGVYLGEQDLQAGVREIREDEDYAALVTQSTAAFSNGDYPELLRLLDEQFGDMPYSLKSLFKDEQKRILDLVLSRTLQDAETSYHLIYEKHGSVLRFTAEFVLNSDLKHTFENDPVDFVRIAMLMELVKREGVEVDNVGLNYAASNSLTRIMQRLHDKPHDMETLERANALTSLFPMTGFSVDTWRAQNLYYSLLSDYEVARKHDPESRAWQEKFLALGEKLGISVPQLEPQAELQMAS